MSSDPKTSSLVSNVLIVLALALRAVDLVPLLASALEPHFPLYAAATMLAVLGVLVLERNHWDRLYISRHRWLCSLLQGLLFGLLLGFSTGLLLAWMRFGVHWLPWGDVLPTLGTAVAAAFFEELMFRSYALSRLAETRLDQHGPMLSRPLCSSLSIRATSLRGTGQ